MIQCPICKNPDSRLKFKLTYEVHACKKCGFEFCPEAKFNKSMDSDLDEQIREKALIQLRKENFRTILDSLKDEIKPNFKGLEVGPGYGWFLEICKDYTIDCEGIEPEVRFNAKYRKNDLKVINGFYPDDIPANTKYDFIIYNDVLEHLPNLERIIGENHAMLNTNGILIINIPIQNGIIYFAAKLAYRFGTKSLLDRMWQFNFHSPHMSYFSKRNLINFVTGHYFKEIKSFKLKTINLSEISDRIKQDKNQSGLARFAISLGVIILFPFLKIFPDTFCFSFRKTE